MPPDTISPGGRTRAASAPAFLPLLHGNPATSPRSTVPVAPTSQGQRLLCCLPATQIPRVGSHMGKPEELPPIPTSSHTALDLRLLAGTVLPVPPIRGQLR